MDFVLYTCSYGGVAPATIASVEKLHASPLGFEWWFQTDDALIGRSRSIAVTQFLKKPRAPYMIFLDGDILFTPADIQMILDALLTGKDVVGGLYSVRGGSYLAQRGFDGKMKIDGDVHEVQFVSTGFVGISLKILQEITKDMPLLHKGQGCECYPVFESGRHEEIYISEDWDFCNKVREAGGTVYAHTNVLLGHLKDAVYTAQQAIQNTAKCPPQAESLWEDFREYTGKDPIPEEKVMKMLADKWNAWEGTTEDFYKDPEAGHLYLSDLAHFSGHRVYHEQRLSPIINSRNLNVLDIGCGIGTALLELCWRNRNLVGYDLSETTLDFARFRVAKQGAKNVTFTNELPDVSDFDLIISIATLEHIPGEELRALLKMLGENMKPGARLYHFSDFKISEQHPMHFDHSEHIDAWLKEAGLAIFDTHWCVKP